MKTILIGSPVTEAQIEKLIRSSEIGPLIDQIRVNICDLLVLTDEPPWNDTHPNGALTIWIQILGLPDCNINIDWYSTGRGRVGLYLLGNPQVKQQIEITQFQDWGRIIPRLKMHHKRLIETGQTNLRTVEDELNKLRRQRRRLKAGLDRLKEWSKITDNCDC
jgi:hypothetical protein